MGEFSSGLLSKIFYISLSLLVIVVNTYFVLQYVVNLGITNVAFIIFTVMLGVVYLLFCLYLTLDMILNMGGSTLASVPFIRKLFSVTTTNYEIQEDEHELSDSDQDGAVEEIAGSREG